MCHMCCNHANRNLLVKCRLLKSGIFISISMLTTTKNIIKKTFKKILINLEKIPFFKNSEIFFKIFDFSKKLILFVFFYY